MTAILGAARSLLTPVRFLYRWRLSVYSSRAPNWASAPYYDFGTKKLHQAKEIKFGEQAQHTLNYSIRVLERKSAPTLNFIAGLEQKAVIAIGA